MIIEIVLGLVIGCVMALTGAGGGILAVPLLSFGAGLGVAQAAPVGLMAVGLAATLGAGIGLKRGNVRYRAALWMAAIGMLAAPAGVWLAHRVDNRALSIVFAALLAFVAWRTYAQARADIRGDGAAAARPPPCTVSDTTGRFVWTAPCARVLAAAGGLAGLLSGLLGVGGGFVMVPALKRYTDLPPQAIVATSLAVIALVSASGVTSSALAGTLDWALALPFAGAALLGMLGGSVIASRLRGPQLQKGFAMIAALVAAGMMVKTLLQWLPAAQ